MDKLCNSKSRILVSALIGGSICCSTVALAESAYELGLDAFKEKRYSHAFQLIKTSAEGGDVKSAFLLSTMYRRGLGAA